MLCSPVPAQRIAESLGSMASEPMVWVPTVSKMGLQEAPPSTVFHRPPEAVPRYRTCSLAGETARAATRPATRPMDHPSMFMGEGPTGTQTPGMTRLACCESAKRSSSTAAARSVSGR